MLISLLKTKPIKGNKKILEDYLIAACNDAMNKLEKETKAKMGSVMNLPGGMKLPFESNDKIKIS